MEDLKKLQAELLNSGITQNFTAKAPTSSTGLLFPDPTPISKGLGLKYLEQLAKHCPRGNYATGRGLSYSALKDFQWDPFSYLKYVLKPSSKEWKNEFALGDAFEAVKTNDYSSIFIMDNFVKPVPDKDFKTKANKEALSKWIKEINAIQIKTGKKVVTKDHIKTTKEMTYASGGPLPDGATQVPVDFVEELTGLSIRGFMDHLRGGHCTEIKTIHDISLASKRFSGHGFNIWKQPAVYSFHDDVDTASVLFCSTDAPYLSMSINLDADQLTTLRQRFVERVLFPFTYALEHGFEAVAAKIVTSRI